MSDELTAEVTKGIDLEKACISVLKAVMDQHSAVIFGGNGYSEEWHKEAVESRGLLNLPTTADALPFLKDKMVVELFEKNGVLSPAELESRFEVYSEQYIKVIEMEANLVISMAKTSIYPAAVRYLAELANSIAAAKSIGLSLDKDTAENVASWTKKMTDKIGELESAAAKDDFDSTETHMQHSAKVIRPLMDAVRECGDSLEYEVADDLWPLPKYQEMLFIK
jgi:glutamine synthetase